MAVSWRPSSRRRTLGMLAASPLLGFMRPAAATPVGPAPPPAPPPRPWSTYLPAIEAGDTLELCLRDRSLQVAIESRWPFNQLGPVASIRFDDPACRPLRESFESARLFERIDLRSDDRDKSEFVNVLVNFKKRSGATHYFAYAEKPRKRDGAVAYSGVFERTPVFFEGDFPRVIRSMKRRGVLKFAYTCC